MFCKECGIKNSDDAFKCINCGTYLKSSDLPLDGTERVKVALYFVLVCISNIFGIIPLLISMAAIYIMKKDKSFDAIKYSRKFLHGYLILLSIGFLGMSIGLLATYSVSEENSLDAIFFSNNKDKVLGTLFAVYAVISTMFIWVASYLFYEPLKAHQDWIINNGIFSDKPDEKSMANSIKETMQIFQKPQSCSIADELLKWKSLLDQGVITEEEFNQRKDSLLK